MWVCHKIMIQSRSRAEQKQAFQSTSDTLQIKAQRFPIILARVTSILSFVLVSLLTIFSMAQPTINFNAIHQESLIITNLKQPHLWRKQNSNPWRKSLKVRRIKIQQQRKITNYGVLQSWFIFHRKCRNSKALKSSNNLKPLNRPAHLLRKTSFFFIRRHKLIKMKNLIKRPQNMEVQPIRFKFLWNLLPSNKSKRTLFDLLNLRTLP